MLYADDTNIFVDGNTKEEAFSKANKYGKMLFYAFSAKSFFRK